MSSDSISYYDWSLSFKKDDGSHNSFVKHTRSRSMNSIGLPDDEFKDYLKKWKEEHLKE
ncbi:MAG: hypothetical protein ACFFD5_00140 [Candidatus Thorarchaeota archaeon]